MAQSHEGKRDLAVGVPLSELDETRLVAGVLGDKDVVLVKGESGIFALDGQCTHKGAPLGKGIVVGDQLRCPWHHACFDARTGAAVAAPALRALACWQVEERDGKAWVTSLIRRQEATSPKSTRPRIVIVGAGAAGAAAATALVALGHGPGTTLIGHEPEGPYDRTMLSKQFLAGAAPEAKLPLDMPALSDGGVTVRLNTLVQSIDPQARQIRLSDGSALAFDKLILATGAEPRSLAVPGAELAHVRTLRSAADARALIAAAADARHIAIVGSSFIGMEAAAAFRDRDIPVTVISPDEQPFAKILGPALSDAIMAVHRQHGTGFQLGRQVRRIEPDHVELDDGTRVKADLVLVGIGVAPRLALAEQAGLTVDEGVVVDAYLRSSAPDIYAVGDIARWPDPHSGAPIRVEHWAVAQRQGEIAALNALGQERRYDVVPFFWTAHFDYSVRYVGHAAEWDATTVEGDAAASDATIRFHKDGREVAVATVERDKDNLKAELAMERRLGERAATLPG